MIMEDGTRYIDAVKWYFRTSENFFEIEKILYQNINWWKLLDIWCACGTYIPILEKLADSVEAIDISEKNIQVARERWYINAHVWDIMNYKTDIKYDILTLIWNNLSIGWDIPWTHKLLDILKWLLKENWKILCTFKKTEEKYFIWKMSIEYNKIISDPFSMDSYSFRLLGRTIKRT